MTKCKSLVLLGIMGVDAQNKHNLCIWKFKNKLKKRTMHCFDVLLKKTCQDLALHKSEKRMLIWKVLMFVNSNIFCTIRFFRKILCFISITVFMIKRYRLHLKRIVNCPRIRDISQEKYKLPQVFFVVFLFLCGFKEKDATNL